MAQAVVENVEDRYVRSAFGWRVIISVGIGAGIAVMILTAVLANLVISPILCRNMVVEACVNSAEISGNIATIIVALIALTVLIRQQIRRSILIVLAATASLWGITYLLQGAGWFELSLWVVALYVLAYSAFAWLARIKSIVIASIVSIILLVVIRLILSI